MNFTKVNFNTAHKRIEQFVQNLTTNFSPANCPPGRLPTSNLLEQIHGIFAIFHFANRRRRRYEWNPWPGTSRNPLSSSPPWKTSGPGSSEKVWETKKGTSRRLLAEGFTPGRFSPNKDMAGSVTQSLACWKDARTLELKVFPAPGSVLFAPLEKSSAQRCAVLLRHASGKPTLICSFGEISLGGKTFLTPWNAWKTCTPGNRWHRSPGKPLRQKSSATIARISARKIYRKTPWIGTAMVAKTFRTSW